MELCAALGAALMNSAGAGPEMNAAWTRVQEIADRLDDADYRLRALWGLWVEHRNKGGHPAALRFAREFSRIAARTADPADLAIGDRMVGTSLHYLGDQTGALEHIERMLGRGVTPAQDRKSTRLNSSH